MRGKIGDKERLGHILDAITEQIEIIGEAANYVTPETKQLFSEVEWKQIIGMRHILIHEYFGVDANLVWQVIMNDIPNLKNTIQKTYSTL